MSKPVRQHTVPRCYLKRFSIDGRGLFELRNKSNKFHAISLTNASVIKHIYTYHEDNGGESFVVEEALSRLETNADLVLEKVHRQGVSCLTEMERVTLADFITVQHYRTKKMKNVADLAEGHLRKPETQERLLDAWIPEISKIYSEKEIADYRERIRNGKAKFGTGQFFVRNFIGNVSRRVRNELLQMEWMVERIHKKVKRSFVTSDTPFAVRNPIRPFENRIVGLNEKDAEFFFPISCRTMLIGTNQRCRDRLLTSALRVDALNKITMVNRYHSLFAPRDEKSILEQVKSVGDFRVPSIVPLI